MSKVINITMKKLKSNTFLDPSLHFVLLCSLTFFLFFICNVAFAAGHYTIEIHKSERKLLVKKNHILQKTYRIASGSGGSGDKLQRGDKMTPTGVYKILHFKDNSRFHIFMQLNYPNAQDALNGLNNGTINHDEFSGIVSSLQRNRMPNQNTDLGGAIGIHGIGDETSDRLALHADENWTKGCIAMKNKEIVELRKYVRAGTSVLIFD